VPNACSAIFARYSSDLQREASIEDQVRACLARIVAEGWERAATYTDHGLSGASRLRPGYQELLEGARAGAFEVVIAEALDRLSRDQQDVAALYKHLAFAGVRLTTLAEGEISELHVGLKGTMNALFLQDWCRRPGAGSRPGAAGALGRRALLRLRRALLRLQGHGRDRCPRTAAARRPPHPR
jgi:site-specific DNA recombinase